jgi:hypothetical protein
LQEGNAACWCMSLPLAGLCCCHCLADAGDASSVTPCVGGGGGGRSMASVHHVHTHQKQASDCSEDCL